MYKLAVILIMFTVIGCKEQVNEDKHPVYLRAESLKKRGAFAEAAKNYNKYLAQNHKSFKTHLELATIYNDHLNDFVLTIYHYKKYLDLAPITEDKEMVKGWLKKSEEELYKKLHPVYKTNTLENEIKSKKIREGRIIKKYNSLIEKNKNLLLIAKKYKNKTIELKKELAIYKKEELTNLKKEPTSMIMVDKKDLVVSETKTNKNNSDKYIVKKGDSLMSIASKFYGSTKHFKKIYNANKKLLKNESDLKVGQKLLIPKL